MNNCKLAVVGLGFIGLPLSLSYALKGAQVTGIDIYEEYVAQINAGKSHHLEYYQGRSLQEILQEQLALGNFRGTTDYAFAASQVSNYIVTVGIDIKNGDPQFGPFQAALESLSTVLKKGDLVLIRSTVVPGTTEELALPILERSGLKAGEDFYLAYSSERIAEGKAFEEFIHMPLAVGGINELSRQKAKELLQVVTQAPIYETSIKIVETAKVIENVQRDVNIAMVQEFARFAEAMGLDTFELIKTANTHQRVNLLTPGPGVGGYCLPNALYYLLPKAEEHQVPLNLLRQARQINDSIPQLIAEEVTQALEQAGKRVDECKVAVLGLAMKDFSNDDRISPPHDVVHLLQGKGIQVSAYDPAVPSHYTYKASSLGEAVQEADALIYLTVQEEFLELDWDKIVAQMKPKAVFYDSKNRIPLRLQEQVQLIRM